jgi:hypothetical protein
MTTKLDPLIYEHDTKEEAEGYDVWFRKKVQEGLDDPGPDIPHEEVMAEMEEIISAAERAQAKSEEARKRK